jgi:hypothetical protein
MTGYAQHAIFEKLGSMAPPQQQPCGPLPGRATSGIAGGESIRPYADPGKPVVPPGPQKALQAR